MKDRPQRLVILGVTASRRHLGALLHDIMPVGFVCPTPERLLEELAPLNVVLPDALQQQGVKVEVLCYYAGDPCY